MTGRIDAADLDGDGDLDIVLTEEETCQRTDAHIFIFRNDGNQNFCSNARYRPNRFIASRRELWRM